jgi:hypothetical protein
MLKDFRFVTAIGLLGLFFGFIGGMYQCQRYAHRQYHERVDLVVAMSWGKRDNGNQAIYGAHVYLVPHNDRFKVMATVYVYRTDSFKYQHPCGVLGEVADDTEAVEKFGTIIWRDDGLQIGTGPEQFFLPRKELQSHR